MTTLAAMMADRPLIDQDFINATREAEAGRCTCRNCKKPGLFGDFITIQYGGGLLYALCLDCVNAGAQIMVRRTLAGIEIVQRSRGAVAVASPELQGPLVKRSA